MAASSAGFLKNSPVSIIRSILRDVHVDHAARADVQVADFAVAHLPVGQADEAAAGVDQRVGKLAQQLVVVGLAGQRRWRCRCDGGRIAPAVENVRTSGFGRIRLSPSSPDRRDS